jgi:hypothetical protein
MQDVKESKDGVESRLIAFLNQHKKGHVSDYGGLDLLISQHQNYLQNLELFYLTRGVNGFLLRQSWVMGKETDYFFAAVSEEVLPPRLGWSTALAANIQDANPDVVEPCPTLVFMADLDYLQTAEGDAVNRQGPQERIPDPAPSVGSSIFIESCGVKEAHGMFSNCPGE